MIRKHPVSRSRVLMALFFSFMLVAGVVVAQEKSGSEPAPQPVVLDQDEEKAVENTEVKAPEQPAAVVEKKEEKPMVGVGAAAPGSHEGYIPSVSTQYGSITVLGVFQVLLDDVYHLTVGPSNKNDDRFEKIGASFQRARIMIKGHVVSENLTYFFQGDAKNEKSFALDMFLGYKFWDTGLSIRIGRFVPEFSYMMPRNTADLAAINYPLYIALPTTYNSKNKTILGSFGVWRQLGLDITYKPIEQVAVTVGVFNGMLNTPYQQDPLSVYMQMGSVPFVADATKTINNTVDNNRAKDVMLRASYKPMKTLSIDFNAYVGFPSNYNADGTLMRNSKGKLVLDDTLIMGGPGVEYNDGKLHVVGEFMWRYLKHREPEVDNVPVRDQKALGGWAHVGYRFTSLIEPILRFDWVDPDIDAKDQMLMRITVGPHFWLEEKHFRILVDLFCDIPLEEMQKRQTNLALQVQFAALW